MFSEIIRQARIASGLSQTELAALTGMRQADISSLESGRRPNPTVELVQRLAGPLGLTLELRPVPQPIEAADKAA